MASVHFHIAPGVVLRVARLAGELVPTRPESPPALDDRSSFVLQIAEADIAIDTASLSTLLDRHVFAYPGSPLSDIRVETREGQLVQRGKLRGLPFSVRSEVTLMPSGEIRLHPRAVKVLGLGVRGLMRFFGLNLQKLTSLEPGHGVRIEGDDFYLDAMGILPPPRMRGKLTRLTVGDGIITQHFGEGSAPTDSVAGDAGKNGMTLMGGRLRFGKLTMDSTDMVILDEDPSDPFDFSLDRYQEQLMAGYNLNTAARGLIVHMPDLSDLPRRAKPPKP